MLNYKIIEDKSKNEWTIIENNKDNAEIKKFKTYKQAKEYCKFLNFGGSFNGWFPTFIVNPIKFKDMNIND